MKIVSWIIIIVGFLFAGLINTTSFKGTFWDEASEQSYVLAENKEEYTVDYVLSDIDKAFKIENYEIGTVIKVIDLVENKIYYYESYKADFIDMSKWQDPIFWAQVVANTLYVSALYSIVLVNKQDDILNSLGKPIYNEKNEEIGSEPNKWEIQYEKLFNSEKDIINKRADFERYLSLIVSRDEELTLIIKALKKRKKRIYTWRWASTIFTFNIFKYKKALKKIDDNLEQLKLSRLSLYDLIDTHIENINVNVKHIDISYDNVFDRVDTNTSEAVSISYSREKETARLIAKSPLGSFVSIFTSLIVLGNIAVTWGEWRGIAMIFLTLGFASGMKVRKAIKNAKKISINTLKSLEKTNNTITTFLLLTPEQVEKLRIMGKKLLELPAPKNDNVELSKDIKDIDYTKDFNYGYE